MVSMTEEPTQLKEADEWTDSVILHRLKLRHYQPMPHGTTELLCLKAAELIERQIEAIKLLESPQ